MKHSLRLKALECPDSDHYDISARKIYLTPATGNKTPVQVISEAWNQIRFSLLDIKVKDMVLVLNRSQSKRSHTSGARTATIEIGQYATCENGAIRFASVLKLVSQLAVRLPRGQVMTRRDFYYQDVDLFQKSQSNSNSTIAMVAHSLGVDCEMGLSIYPSQKGLMYGNCAMRVLDNEHSINSTLELSYTQEPILIPHLPFKALKMGQLQFLSCVPDAVVVIEKESVFKSFCAELKRSASSSGDMPRLLVITGKGFPDHLTRDFVTLVSRTVYAISSPPPPVLGFMDSDAYGVSIFKNYVYGNRSQSPSINDHCYRANMKLAGVMLLDYSDGWLDISNRDTKVIQGLLNSIASQSLRTAHLPGPVQASLHRELAKWHRELTRGLMLRKKSEMNVVNGNCNAYIWQKINDTLRTKC